MILAFYVVRHQQFHLVFLIRNYVALDGQA